ncbi:MAG: hypothetical protein HZA54_12805 [Planctomycetes bacterium]|nr:hypothetical protein [Planctomycetota bacterium]
MTAIAVDPITLAQEQRERIGFHSNPFDIVHVAVPTPVSGGPAGPPGDSEGDAVQAPPHEFALTGLYVSWAGDCAAILDGQVVRLEDPVADGWRVAAITEAGIRLRKPGALERFVPKLNPLDTRPRNPTAAPPAAPPGGPAGDGARPPAAPAGSSGPPPGPGAGPGTTPRVD